MLLRTPRVSEIARILLRSKDTAATKILSATGIVCTITTMLVMASLLPFAITDLIPMPVIYIWINIGWFLVSFIVTLIVICCVLKQDADKKGVLLCALAGALNLYFLINPILYNYSQYFYFGDTYLHSIYSEYHSRDTNVYFQVLQNETQSIGHLLLSSF